MAFCCGGGALISDVRELAKSPPIRFLVGRLVEWGVWHLERVRMFGVDVTYHVRRGITRGSAHPVKAWWGDRVSVLRRDAHRSRSDVFQDLDPNGR